jgi:hypothetical protein
MKKLFIAGTLVFLAFSAFAQDTNFQITDYFPLAIGNTWTYASASGKTAEITTIRNSMADNVSNDGTSIYLFELQFVGIGSGTTLYSIKQNKVVILVERNIFGQRQERTPPFPVLAPAGQEWRYNDRGDDLRYRTSKSSCVFDGKTFNDCILVEEQIVDGRNVLRTKKSYYARGIGLVYVTLQSPGESESVYRKLESCNFINIANEGIDNEIPDAGNDLNNALMFFFIKLGKYGLVDAENKGAELENNNQTLVFNALYQIAKNNTSIVLDMMSSNGTVRISTYLSSPVPYFLNMTYGKNNRCFAPAIDKAIKIIVMSNILNLLQDKLKNSVPDQRFLMGIKEAEPLLSNLYKVDSSISDDDYNNILEPLYRACINMYIQYGGK